MESGRPANNAVKTGRPFNAQDFLELSVLSQDLVDQLFNSSQKRLARALLLLAEYDDQHPLTVNGSLLSVLLHERA